MSKFNEDFKTELYQVIENIEDASQVEVVTIIKGNSGNYTDISFFLGVFLMFWAYTFFMFAPTIFDVYLIYFLTIAAFFIGFILVEFIKPIKRILSGRKRLNKNVDIYSRAIFQKGGLRHTKDKVGILIYVSLFENKINIIADKGVENIVPDAEFESIKSSFQKVFKASNFQGAFIETLRNCKKIFSKYLPKKEDDINELPDKLNIDL